MWTVAPPMSSILLGMLQQPWGNGWLLRKDKLWCNSCSRTVSGVRLKLKAETFMLSFLLPSCFLHSSSLNHSHEHPLSGCTSRKPVTGIIFLSVSVPPLPVTVWTACSLRSWALCSAGAFAFPMVASLCTFPHRNACILDMPLCLYLWFPFLFGWDWEGQCPLQTWRRAHFLVFDLVFCGHKE